MRRVRSNEQIAEIRKALRLKLVDYIEREKDMPEPDEGILQREREREQEVEQAWDQVCGHEGQLTLEDEVFGGMFTVAAFCIAEKGHPASVHTFCPASHKTPGEIMEDAFPHWVQVPF